MGDIIGSCAALVIFSPVLLTVAFLVWLLIGSPVIFRQIRPGLRGKPFNMIKFRTMRYQQDASGNVLPDEIRLTTLGRTLRLLSLDEFPGLWNVLKGDMSLVGPRPLLMEYIPLYSKRQARRHEVKPGVTGWAQINGRNALAWEEKFELDLWYVDHQSLWLDLRILILTIWRVLARKDISSDGHATMPPFGGTQDKGSLEDFL
jgi:sugar transferase EpsL